MSFTSEIEFWPEIQQLLQQQPSDDDGIHHCHDDGLFTTNSSMWPANAIDLDPFCDLDEDGWNLYRDDQNGVDDWYSFVENKTPPDTTIAFITHFYDTGRQAVSQLPIVVQQETSVYQREPATTTTAVGGGISSSSIRSSLVKLVCFSTAPENNANDDCQHHEDGHDGLGAAAVLASGLSLSEDDLERRDALPERQRMHNSSKMFRDKGFILSTQELDHYCGINTIGRRGIADSNTATISSKKKNKNDSISAIVENDDDGSIDGSCNSSSSSSSSGDSSSEMEEHVDRTAAASSLAGCTIDSELARALEFCCTPEKLQQKRMDSQDYGLVRRHMTKNVRDDSSSSVAGQVVADRREWLLAAFKKSKQEEDEKPSSSVAEVATRAPHLGYDSNKNFGRKSEANVIMNKNNSKATTPTKRTSNRSSSLAATMIDKFGGRPQTAVQRRKQQWEQKLVSQNDSAGRTLRIRTQWECHQGGSYYKKRSSTVAIPSKSSTSTEMARSSPPME